MMLKLLPLRIDQDILDDALLRPGRFDRIIEIPLQRRGEKKYPKYPFGPIENL